MAGFAAGMSIMGAVQQAEGAKAMAKDEAAMEQYNANLMEAEATETRRNTAETQKLGREEMRKTLASNRVAVGGSGVQMTGSPAEHQLNVIDDYAYAIGETGRAGELQARRFESMAEIHRMRKKSALRRGRIQVYSAYMGGAGNTASAMS